jgi:hypothetical protein
VFRVLRADSGESQMRCGICGGSNLTLARAPLGADCSNNVIDSWSVHADPATVRIGLALVASVAMTLGLVGHATACITYTRGFALGGSDNVTLDRLPKLLLVAINTGDSEQLSWGVIHGTAYWLHVDRVVRGESPRPLRIRTADACHPKNFGEGETLVVASSRLPSENPVPGLIDRQAVFWISPDGKMIDQERSPSVNGLRPTTVDDLIDLLTRLPDTALVSPIRSSSPLLGIGIALLLLAALAYSWRKSDLGEI